jgi:hypothetical protein
MEPTMSEARPELVEWWQDVLEDLEPDTTTFTLTLSRTMAEQTMAALRILNVPTEEMVSAAAKAMFKTGADMEGNTYPRRLARAALTAAFNTLGIQEKTDPT